MGKLLDKLHQLVVKKLKHPYPRQHARALIEQYLTNNADAIVSEIMKREEKGVGDE